MLHNLHTRSQGTLQEWQLRTGWNVRSSYWMHKLHHLQARGINKSMRIAQKYNTKQARSTPLEQVTSHPAVDATLDVSPRFQMTIPTPALVILVPQQVHPIVRRPTTRSACRACWRAKRNHLRTPDVRAAQRWSFLSQGRYEDDMTGNIPCNLQGKMVENGSNTNY
jgi:hypothetical protein